MVLPNGRNTASNRLLTSPGEREAMNRNILYAVIAVLAVGVAVMGYRVYRQHQNAGGIDINIGNSGISIEKN
jgi:hypothetical protein